MQLLRTEANGGLRAPASSHTKDDAVTSCSQAIFSNPDTGVQDYAIIAQLLN